MLKREPKWFFKRALSFWGLFFIKNWVLFIIRIAENHNMHNHGIGRSIKIRLQRRRPRTRRGHCCDWVWGIFLDPRECVVPTVLRTWMHLHHKGIEAYNLSLFWYWEENLGCMFYVEFFFMRIEYIQEKKKRKKKPNYRWYLDFFVFFFFMRATT